MTGADAKTFEQASRALADWWLTHGVDPAGGFRGEVSAANRPAADAAKGVILNTRILWFFSEIARTTQEPRYCAAAERAAGEVLNRFLDAAHGGVYWLLAADGTPRDTRKHVYAQAFAIYALAAYVRLTRSEPALAAALALFERIESVARDRHHGGYFEAFSAAWGPLEQVALSDKEQNWPKTMNTHLHLLEAYIGLHDCLLEFDHPSRPRVTRALGELLELYCARFVDLQQGHLRMFFTADWQPRSQAFSFGHDIESSWLIGKAQDSLAAAQWDASHFDPHVAALVGAALRDGLQADGGMADEWEFRSRQLSESSWWVQAEAMVGFASYWRRGHGEHYLAAALRVWRHILVAYADGEGEWYWYHRGRVPLERQPYKLGPWKGPYHNGRALLLMARWLAEGSTNALGGSK